MGDGALCLRILGGLPAVDRLGEKETVLASLLSVCGDLGPVETVVLCWALGELVGLELPLLLPREVRSGVLTVREAGVRVSVCALRRGGDELVVVTETVAVRGATVVTGGLGFGILFPLRTATSFISFLWGTGELWGDLEDLAEMEEI